MLRTLRSVHRIRAAARTSLRYQLCHRQLCAPLSHLAPVDSQHIRRFATNAFLVEEDDPELGILALDVQEQEHISIKWSDGTSGKYHLVHLRAWCQCPSCQHETGQRLLNYSDVDRETLDIADISVKDSTVSIVWSPDGHKSTFTWDWLREHSYSDDALDERSHSMTTIPLLPEDPIPVSDYAAVMDTENEWGLFSFLHQIVEHGFSVVKGTPSQDGEVQRLAERIAPLSHSFLYGGTFDVIAKQDPVNIAYTNERLKHHLDLAYYESPPGIQMLHALRFDESVEGGESIFVDVFAAADELRRLHPDHFYTLSRVPATFKKHHLSRSNPAVMEYQRPHIQLNHRDEVINVFWSPPFEGPLRVPFDDVLPYYEAYKALDEIIESEKFKIEFKLKQGDTVVFNQRRMLHGRNHFMVGSNGVRHLQGAYLNIDEVWCRFNVLRLTLTQNDDPPIPNRRAGNGNFS